MPDIIVKQQPATSLTIQSNSTQLVIRQAAANNITISTGSSSYVLPAATNSTLGGIIVGSNLTIANGVLSATSAGGGVTAFNNRTGNVTLTANDVTAVANGIYIADSTVSGIQTSYGTDVFYGQYQTRGASPGFPFVAGGLFTASRGIVGISNSTDPCNIEFQPGESFNLMRFRSYNQSVIFSSADGLYAETGTASWNWTANTVLTQGRGDARYQPVGGYLTSANLTWSNITGKPTFATVATSGSYTDLANTPNLSLYLTTANAASTYLPSANFSFSNLTGKPTTLSGYGITDGLTSATAAAMYLPSANFTYANITGKPTLATVATSGSYTDLANTPASYTLPNATVSTLGGVIVGANLSIANGVLSANASTYTLPAATNSTLGGIIVGANLSVSANGTLSANIPSGGGGFANGDTLNGGTF